jgi:hypothetical protein
MGERAGLIAPTEIAAKLDGIISRLVGADTK